MPIITLVRHGEASAGWGDHTDPGLSELGQSQAVDVAAALAPLGPQPILVSPLRRTRETAAPLASRWGVEPTIEPRVAEIPSPHLDVTERTDWLRKIMASRWETVDASLRTWAAQLVDCLLALRDDTIVVSHFVAINAAIGAATDDERVMCARVGNCSTTTLESRSGRLTLLDLTGEVTMTEVR